MRDTHKKKRQRRECCTTQLERESRDRLGASTRYTACNPSAPPPENSSPKRRPPHASPVTTPWRGRPTPTRPRGGQPSPKRRPTCWPTRGGPWSASTSWVSPDSWDRLGQEARTLSTALCLGRRGGEAPNRRLCTKKKVGRFFFGGGAMCRPRARFTAPPMSTRRHPHACHHVHCVRTLGAWRLGGRQPPRTRAGSACRPIRPERKSMRKSRSAHAPRPHPPPDAPRPPTDGRGGSLYATVGDGWRGECGVLGQLGREEGLRG